jgi:hypothetical protein
MAPGGPDSAAAGSFAQKSVSNPGICGKKDTAGVPQRGTSI